MSPLLELEGVHTFYGSIEALKGVSLEVNEGEVVTLIGANGAGKSTTLRSINGLNTPKRGRIVFKGKDITRRSPHDIVEMGISQSPEGRRHLDPARYSVTPLLFVRERADERAGVTMAFRYLGPVDPDGADGERPITIEWRLR